MGGDNPFVRSRLSCLFVGVPAVITNLYSLETLNCFNNHIKVSEVIKLFSCSTQLSMKFKLLINFEIAKINEIFKLKSQKLVIYHANKCQNVNNINCSHCNIYQQDKFQAELS